VTGPSTRRYKCLANLVFLNGEVKTRRDAALNARKTFGCTGDRGRYRLDAPLLEGQLPRSRAGVRKPWPVAGHPEGRHTDADPSCQLAIASPWRSVA
jgi:hypothetical protein